MHFKGLMEPTHATFLQQEIKLSGLIYRQRKPVKQSRKKAVSERPKVYNTSMCSINTLNIGFSPNMHVHHQAGFPTLPASFLALSVFLFLSSTFLVQPLRANCKTSKKTA